MKHSLRRDPADTVTVYSYMAFDFDTREMQVVATKATPEAIAAMHRALLVQGTAEAVPRHALDGNGHFRRLPTGWGELH